MNAIDLLTEDHRRIEHLFSKYEELGERDVVERLCLELTSHSLVEERLLYPLVRDRLPDGPSLVDAGTTDHDAVKALIAEVDGITPAALPELVDELRVIVQRHVEEEERLVLPRLREAVGDAALEELGARMVDEGGALGVATRGPARGDRA